MTDQNDTQAAINAALASADPKPIGAAGLHAVVVPAGGTVQLVDADLHADKYALAPRRLRAVYKPATVDAFSGLVERFDDTATTTIWVHPKAGRIIAVFNDNEAQPGWRDHRADLQLTHTAGWRHWTGRDGAMMSQRDFAEHIEDGLGEIAAPPAADLLEMAQTFQAKSDVTFRSSFRLVDGRVQAQYDEQVDATAGTGVVPIPAQFTLAVAPFVGEPLGPVTARLRWRVRDGKLTLGYRLERVEDVLLTCLEAIAERLRNTHSLLPVYLGEPG